MTVTHTNRKGHIYHLHQGTTKTGRPRYYFSKKAPDTAVETIPDGYEIYESPNGQVFLRRQRAQHITPDELALVEAGVKRYAAVSQYIIDVKEKAIVVYTADQDDDAISSLVALALPERRQLLQDFLIRNSNYTAMLRFVLADEEERTFAPERYCFLGGIDDWMFIGSPDKLANLARKYLPHLGQESFYELY